MPILSLRSELQAHLVYIFKGSLQYIWVDDMKLERAIATPTVADTKRQHSNIYTTKSTLLNQPSLKSRSCVCVSVYLLFFTNFLLSLLLHSLIHMFICIRRNM